MGDLTGIIMVHPYAGRDRDGVGLTNILQLLDDIKHMHSPAAAMPNRGTANLIAISLADVQLPLLSIKLFTKSCTASM